MRPSYATGFARYAADSKYPELRRRLVGAWCPFLGNTGPNLLHDMSGRHNHSSNFSGPTWTQDEYGPALIFNGSSDFIDTVDIDFITGGFTLYAWIKTSASKFQRILSKFTGSTNQMHMMVLDTGEAFLELHDGITWRESQTAGTYNDGKWHQFVGVVDGSNLTIYADLETGTPGVHDNSFPANNAVWRIGARNDGDEYFDGMIDEIRIYNRILSPGEISQSYINRYAMWELDYVPYARVVAAAVHAGRLVNARRLKSKVGGGLV